jgi:hypothetical protein
MRGTVLLKDGDCVAIYHVNSLDKSEDHRDAYLVVSIDGKRYAAKEPPLYASEAGGEWAIGPDRDRLDEYDH